GGRGGWGVVRMVTPRAAAVDASPPPSPGESFAHIAKWSTIVFWSVPSAYVAVVLADPVLQAWAGLALALALRSPLGLPLSAVVAALSSRVLVGLLQDRLVGGLRLPVSRYLSLLIADVGALAFVPFALRRTVSWRGKTYRLARGGRAEVL
ncbi:MAG: hypothetical protein ACHQ2Z_17310, partial [Elusimicrobiota bacterium]